MCGVRVSLVTPVLPPPKMSASALVPGDAKNAGRDGSSAEVPERVVDGTGVDAKNPAAAAAGCSTVGAKVQVATAEEEASTSAGSTPLKAYVVDIEYKARRPSPMLETEKGEMFSPLTCVAKRERIPQFLMARNPPIETRRAVLTLSKWKQNGVGNAMWLLLIPYGFSKVPAQFMENGGKRAIALASAMRAWDLLRKCPPDKPKWREALCVLRDLPQVLCPDFKNETIFDIPKEMAILSWGPLSNQPVFERMLQALVDDATVPMKDESKPTKYYSMNRQAKILEEGRSIIATVKQAIKSKHHTD